MSSDDPPFFEQVTLRQLAMFDATVSTGSVGAAARMLGVSQPAVTHALGKLERVVGHSLLDRGHGGSIANDAGRILHRRVARLRTQIAAGLAAAKGDASSQWVRSRAAAMTSTQISCHIAIAEHGSFRAAAVALDISEPALHRTARELERLVEAPLYRRQSRHIAVAPAGADLARSLSVALAELTQARDEIAAAYGGGASRIALGCLPQMPKPLLAQALGSTIARHPSLAVSLEEGSYRLLIGALRSGRIDMVIGALRGVAADDIEEQELFNDPYVVVARAGHPLAGERRPGVASLRKHGWVVPPIGTPRRDTQERLFERLGIRHRIVLETNSVAMTIATLVRSDCLALTSSSLARIEFADEELASIAIRGVGERRPVGVTLRAGWLPTAMQADFLGELRRQCSVSSVG